MKKIPYVLSCIRLYLLQNLLLIHLFFRSPQKKLPANKNPLQNCHFHVK